MHPSRPHPIFFSRTPLDTNQFTLQSRRAMQNETPTLPPTKDDETVAHFEAQLKQVGEARARWDALMDLLEGKNDE